MAERKRIRREALTAGEQAAFLARLEAHGNARLAAVESGAREWAVYRRKTLDLRFAAAWALAVERAGVALPARAPGTDRVRRNSSGRTQLAAPRAGEWSARTERLFLDHLSATANSRAAADAAGVSVSGAWLRRRRVPAFADAWAEAVDDGHARLEMLLMERGAALLGGVDRDGHAPDGARADAAARNAFDPQIAMWLLKRRDAARAGAGQRRGGWRPREPDIEEVRAEVLRKVAAIERAEARGLRAGASGREGTTGGSAC